jgi:hypothetical protein
MACLRMPFANRREGRGHGPLAGMRREKPQKRRPFESKSLANPTRLRIRRLEAQ